MKYTIIILSVISFCSSALQGMDPDKRARVLQRMQERVARNLQPAPQPQMTQNAPAPQQMSDEDALAAGIAASLGHQEPHAFANESISTSTPSPALAPQPRPTPHHAQAKPAPRPTPHHAQAKPAPRPTPHHAQAKPAQRPIRAIHAPAAEQLPLPARLQALGNATIIHCRVTQQGSNQCGSRSVANALAVQNIIMSGEALTPANIRAHASHFDGILINRVIEDNVVADLADTHGLENTLIMAKIPKEQKGVNEPFIVYSLDAQTHSLDALVENMLTNETMTAHIICNTGGHWVLVTVIKQAGQKPTILYMDSGNAPLANNSIATDMIQYLYEHCIG